MRKSKWMRNLISENNISQNDLILPILNRDSDGDGEADLKNLEEYVIFTNGIKFKLGKFILVIIKFIIILFIVYQFSKLAKKNNL